MSRIHEALKRAEQDRVNHIEAQEAAVKEKSTAAPSPGNRPGNGSAGGSGDNFIPPGLVTSDRLEMPPVFAERTAESDADIGRAADQRAAVHEAALRSDAVPRLHGQQLVRFDDLWQASCQPGWRVDSKISVFADPATSPLAAEQFRTLRSRLYQIRDRQPLKSVLITSALASEGKTFVATNLAQSLARQQGCKVLLVDGDLRAPGLHAALGAPVAPGLSDYLGGSATDTAILQKGLADLLCLIPAGNRTDNPLELLANGRFELLLEKLAPLFDWVVLDSPPVVPVSDALVLADSCDGVLSVVRSAFTDVENAQRACHELQGKNLLGIVLNCADEGASYAQYGNYELAPTSPEGATAHAV